MPAEVINALPNLTFIATRSTGFDHIDLEAAKARNIQVANVPSYGEHTVAEYAFALLLTLSRNVYQSYHQLRDSGTFDRKTQRGFDLSEKTMGVVGTGRIGKNVVRIAKGFNMNVHAFDVHPDDAFAKEMGITYMSLDEVFKTADVITLHVPYLESTHHLVNKEAFASMKDGVYLINDSRGAVVSTPALLEALHSGKVAGAALDVLEEEGPLYDEMHFLVEGQPEQEKMYTTLANHALINMSNVIVTPHNAFNTWEGLTRILETTLGNIESYKKGTPTNIVSK
jgi:D-lactate dehydrogenase